MRPWTGSLRACRVVASSRVLLFPGRVQQRWYARRASPARAAADAADEPAADVVDWENAFRIDPEAKLVETEAGALPLSPVMDPEFWDRRAQHKRPKAKPTVGALQNSVERQVSRSPYARALATPLRYDAVTRNRLPSFFMTDFKLIAHPEDGKAWWVPHSLLSSGAAASSADKGADAAEKPGRLLGPTGYALARYEVLEAFMGRKAAGLGQMYRKLLGPSSSAYKGRSASASWRPDMHDFVLDLMRRQIVDDLLYLSRLCAEQQRHYITRCFGWGDVKFKHKGSVLWFDEPVEDGKPAGDKPSYFATIDVGDEVAMTTIAIHNVALLLGDEHAAKVRSEAAVLGEGSIFMLAGRRTVDVQMKLWKLHCFLADYRSLK